MESESVASVSPVENPQRAAAIDFLLGRINYERMPVLPYGKRQLKLDRMRQLLTRLGNPDAGMPIVHVAGTKGKGSTSAFVASILSASSYKVGLFSSPHLERIEERFGINHTACPTDVLVDLITQLRPVVEAMDQESELAAAEGSSEGSLSPTYFELTTAIALMYFAQEKVDLAVLEVGLGGRLDSTNVCQPAVTVITSISLDHTKQLGNTTAEIAAEKAGIIKPGVPVLCGQLDPEPRHVIANIARQHGSRMIEAGEDFTHQYKPHRHLDHYESIGRISFSEEISEETFELENVPLRIIGSHQAANAALAVATCLELKRQGWLISSMTIWEGLSAAKLPARVEIISHDPTVILDVAHNVAAAQALVDVLTTSFDTKQRILVLAVSKDKDVAGIVRVLLPHFRQVVATEYQENPRAVPVAELGKIIRDELAATEPASATEVIECSLPEEAWQQAQLLAQTTRERSAKSLAPLICVTGSFFIAAELRRKLIANA